MMRSTLLAMLLGFGTAACTVVDFHAPDAGGGVDASGDVALEATSPAADAVSVDVVTDLTLTFTGAIDPDSIDGAIHVYERSSRREVPVAEATWDDATHTLTATLVRPLDYGMQHRVEVDGLTADGEPVAVPTFRFRTYVNEYQRFRKWVGGIPTERTDYIVDVEGFHVTVAGYTAGPDTVLDTGDDVILGGTVYDYGEDGAYRGGVSSSGPGADAQWWTADDAISSISVYDFGDTDAGHHRTRSFSDPGVDAQWRTADDVVSYWVTLAYDDQDRLIRQVSYNGTGSLGPDGTPHTADDVPTTVYATSYPSATLVERLHYNGPGLDGTWLTTDDAVFGRSVTTLDAAGNATATRSFDAASVPLWHQVIVRDASGLPARTHWYTGDGPDDVWFTADDDLMTEYLAYSYDAEHRRTRTAFLDFGPNRVGPDADDVELRAFFQYDLTH